MATTIFNHSITQRYKTTSASSVLTRAIDWCTNQQHNRLLWLGIILAAHGCVLTPLTIFAVVFAGTNMFLFMLAFVAMGAALVTNLAAMPTKYTIPVFAVSIVADAAIIMACLASGLSLANVF